MSVQNYICQVGLSDSVLATLNYDILGIYYGIMQWIWHGVNLKCTDAYAILEWENDTKFHVFATKHKVNT
jgi:hypothetical protein